jgi:hypothetical protein
MVKITFSLSSGRDSLPGPRFSKYDEPYYTDTPGKKRSRLKDKRKKIDDDTLIESDKATDEVFVSKVNWSGRRERN